MKYVIWTVQIIAALLFAMAGVMKIITPYDQIVLDPNMQWAEDFSSMQIIGMGALEVLGAIGLIVPMFIGKFRKLVPLAAVGLGLMMIGAAITHMMRGEPIVINLILMAAAFAIAYWRRGTPTETQKQPAV